MALTYCCQVGICRRTLQSGPEKAKARRRWLSKWTPTGSKPTRSINANPKAATKKETVRRRKQACNVRRHCRRRLPRRAQRATELEAALASRPQSGCCQRHGQRSGSEAAPLRDARRKAGFKLPAMANAPERLLPWAMHATEHAARCKEQGMYRSQLTNETQ